MFGLTRTLKNLPANQADNNVRPIVHKTRRPVDFPLVTGIIISITYNKCEKKTFFPYQGRTNETQNMQTF